jgi:hypothetical protein
MITLNDIQPPSSLNSRIATSSAVQLLISGSMGTREGMIEAPRYEVIVGWKAIAY